MCKSLFCQYITKINTNIYTYSVTLTVNYFKLYASVRTNCTSITFKRLSDFEHDINRDRQQKLGDIYERTYLAVRTTTGFLQ